MNQKTNKWAYKISSPEDSEIAQRIAFSFGYSWSGKKTVQHEKTQYLIFDSDDNKSILWTSAPEKIYKSVCEIILSGDYAMLQARLQSPPKNVLWLKDWIIYKDGTVYHKDTELEISGQEFRKLVEEWTQFVEG